MKAPTLALALVSAMLVNAFGRQQQPTPTPPQPTATPAPAATPAPPQEDDDRDDVVRITTKLVQVDAVVTDKDGRQVTDLTADDFEIMENDRPQSITNFSYISAVPPPGPAEKTEKTEKAEKTAREGSKAAAVPPVPPVRLRPEQVRRAIALVVDDLRMSPDGIHMARQALRKYVDEQMQPGDLIAIIRTSAGIGALQQFTSDRQQLLAAVERVRPITRSTRLGAFTSVNVLDRLETQATEPTMDMPGEQGEPPSPSAIPADKRRAENLGEFRNTLFTVGTLGALNFVVRGLRELPGRKAVVLFSDGISIFNQNSDTQDRDERVLGALRHLVDQANRASVVIYSMDTRGLQPTGLTAADSTAGGPLGPDNSGPPGPVGGVDSIRTDQVGLQVLGTRSAEMFEGQNGLNYLSRETGGTAFFNQNDLGKGIRRALDDIRGYYLIGYRPDESTFDPTSGRRRFNTWTIKVKGRPNLKVRTRTGFFGVAEDEAGGKRRTRAEQMMEALLSPFSSGGVGLQLTSFFMNDAGNGSTIRSVLLMDARNLTFTPHSDGRQQTVLDVVAVTLGEDGQVVDQVTITETIRVKPEVVERFMREGMVYGMNVPAARPGAYQLRVAVRDSASGRIGSASQYVEVPNVSKDKLTLSSLVVMGNKPATTARELISSVLGAPVPSSSPAAASRVVAGGEGMYGTEVAQASPASRLFRHGMYLDYACVVFNARPDKSKKPKVTTQVRLFHQNKEVFVGEVLPLETGGQSDLKRLVIARRLQLGTILEPGDYVLHLTVTDAAGQRTTTGWIDFKLTN
jgi:VWFA-related protein